MQGTAVGMCQMPKRRTTLILHLLDLTTCWSRWPTPSVPCSSPSRVLFPRGWRYGLPVFWNPTLSVSYGGTEPVCSTESTTLTGTTVSNQSQKVIIKKNLIPIVWWCRRASVYMRNKLTLGEWFVPRGPTSTMTSPGSFSGVSSPPNLDDSFTTQTDTSQSRGRKEIRR